MKKHETLDETLEKMGLEIYNTSAGTVASICGVREILAYWESFEELMQWAYSKTGDVAYLELTE
jgi:hypothetical protein